MMLLYRDYQLDAPLNEALTQRVRVVGTVFSAEFPVKDPFRRPVPSKFVIIQPFLQEGSLWVVNR